MCSLGKDGSCEVDTVTQLALPVLCEPEWLYLKVERENVISGFVTGNRKEYGMQATVYR